jgi:hypothetical protein
LVLKAVAGPHKRGLLGQGKCAVAVTEVVLTVPGVLIALRNVAAL